MKQKLKDRLLGSVWFTEIQVFLLNTWYLVRREWVITFPFLVIYSVFDIIMSSILVRVAIRLAMKLKGLTYIGPDNIVSFLTFPGTILLFLVMSVLVCVLHIIEISGIMHAYSMSSVGKKSTLRGIVSTGLKSGVRTFSPRNWAMIPFIMVLIPLTGFFSLSFSSIRAVIPSFIREYIEANDLYRALYLVIYAVMLLVEITYIFSMNIFLLEDSGFFAACRKSRRLIRGKYGITVACLVLVSILFSLGVTALSSMVSSCAINLYTLFSGNLSRAAAVRLASWILVVNQFLGNVIAPAVNIAALTALFFHYLEQENMLASMARHAFQDSLMTKKQAMKAAAVFAAAVLVLRFTMTAEDVAAVRREAMTEPRRPEVFAHRGDSVNAPENSMPAFEMAVLEQTDGIELDVHRTKDGVLVVSHDESMERISGLQVNVSDLTYAEIQEIDTGSWFSKNFGYVRLSTLDEVLKLCRRNNVRVQIEIKSPGPATGMEEPILQCINDNDMRDLAVIISLEAEPLKKVRELDPGIRTAYCMYAAWDHVEDVGFSDDFTVEERNVTPELAAIVHASGGKLYAWTINSEESVQNLIDCGVDGILTDNPIMLKSALDHADYTGGIRKLLRQYLAKLQDF